VISHLQSSLSLWRLAWTPSWFQRRHRHQPSEPPEPARGIEWSNRYIPHDWLLVDLDLSASRAQFTDSDPRGSYIPERSTGSPHWA